MKKTVTFNRIKTFWEGALSSEKISDITVYIKKTGFLPPKKDRNCGRKTQI